MLADPSLAVMRARYRAHLADATPEAMLALMDEQRVQGALVVTPAIYGYDNSYSTDAHGRHPDRFRVVGRADPGREDIHELLAAWGGDPAYVGLRHNLWAPAAVSRFLARHETGCSPLPRRPDCDSGERPAASTCTSGSPAGSPSCR